MPRKADTIRLTPKQWELVVEGYKIAHWMIVRRVRDGEDVDELWDEGDLTHVLMRCARAFDPARGKWTTLVCRATSLAVSNARKRICRDAARYVQLPEVVVHRCLRATPFTIVVAAEDSDRIRVAVTHLRKRRREAIERVHYDGQTVDEAAASMGISDNGVRQLVYAGCQEAARWISANYPTESRHNREDATNGSEIDG